MPTSAIESCARPGDTHARPAGVEITLGDAAALDAQRAQAVALLSALGLRERTEVMPLDDGRCGLRLRLLDCVVREWAPQANTLLLDQHLDRDSPGHPRALDREIVAALLLGPLVMPYPSVDEFESAIDIRRHIVEAGRKTRLAFATSSAERPERCWAYDEDKGFTIRAGCSLVEALTLATQPEVSGGLYSFSCYRATEYVILLAIAEVVRERNPVLYEQLEQRCQQRAIRSAEFHDVFLREFGSMEEPLPPCYYVPGDRLWFRNPDAASSDASGYEGSWVFYLGGGLFTNFWKADAPFTLESKCIEIYHWRHATFKDAAGETRIDEDIVESQVRDTLSAPQKVHDILSTMMHLRAPRGVHGQGGCIDATRECARWVCPNSSDLVLPVQ